MWERAFRRVQLPLAYSAGFSPRPKVSFGLALPTGHESVAEYLDVELADRGRGRRRHLARPAVGGVAARRRRHGRGADRARDPLLAGGRHVVHVALGGRSAAKALDPLGSDELAWPRRGAVLAASSLVVTRTRKGEEVTDDIRAGILTLQVLGPVGPDPSYGVVAGSRAGLPAAHPPTVGGAGRPWTPVSRSATCGGCINGFCATARGGSPLRWPTPPARRTRRTPWSVRHEKGTRPCPTLRRPARNPRAGCSGPPATGSRKATPPRPDPDRPVTGPTGPDSRRGRRIGRRRRRGSPRTAATAVAVPESIAGGPVTPTRPAAIRRPQPSPERPRPARPDLGWPAARTGADLGRRRPPTAADARPAGRQAEDRRQPPGAGPRPGRTGDRPAARTGERRRRPTRAPGDGRPRPARRRRRPNRGRSGPDRRPVEATLVDDPVEVDDETLERRRGRERKGRPVGRYLMVVHSQPAATQIAVLEGRSLIEHYVSRPADDATQIDGNIYLGRVQNVLPGMEAAFIDIGTPKNAVLYRGDVRYDKDDLEAPAEAGLGPDPGQAGRGGSGRPHRAAAQDRARPCSARSPRTPSAPRAPG